MLLQDYNVSIFKEPRGFMKIIQLVFVVVALAVLVNFKSTGSIEVNPNDGVNPQYTAKFTVKYDFDADDYTFIGRFQNAINLGTDQYGANAAFFVAVCSLTLVYVLVFALSYVFVEPRLNPAKADIFHLINFIGTCTTTLLWLVAGSVWAHATDGVPTIAEEAFVEYRNMFCRDSKTDCTSTLPGYAGMIVAVIVAFLNFFLWCFDGWFTFKETKMFRDRFRKYEVSGAVKFKHKKPEEGEQQTETPPTTPDAGSPVMSESSEPI